MFFKYISKKYIGWQIALSPLCAILLLQISKIFTNCDISTTSISACNFHGINIGYILSTISMFSAWGWIVTVPCGVIINFIVEQRNRTYCNFCGGNINISMKRWITNYNTPQFIALFLLSFGIIPGLLFILWSWDKYFCQNCKKVKSYRQ